MSSQRVLVFTGVDCGRVCAVPIIPDWVRGEALALWSTQDAPLASLLNHTVRHIDTDTGNTIIFLHKYILTYLGRRRTLNSWRTYS